ncbi:hypothetical protein FJT64_013521 [Amphibalanus amphitrite]|uniref:Uncharacterized protein n=1 Tax=Amphibalanus amphitrite TaxID=1232801 RepID=A0A6A4UWF2_AMPAM|nr:hypothetical protein FJT64_013521 [Amphibalanus amphitrite]
MKIFVVYMYKPISFVATIAITMSPSSSLLLLLLASCVLAMPADHLEASGLGPVEAEGDEAVVVEAGDGNMATGDAAFASNFGSDDKGGVSTSFSVTASAAGQPDVSQLLPVLEHMGETMLQDVVEVVERNVLMVKLETRMMMMVTKGAIFMFLQVVLLIEVLTIYLVLLPLLL